jgi:DNA-binding PadR family transcriptional regulator
MRLLSRSEELVLLTVWKLQDQAYCIPIRKTLIKVTGKRWSFGSIYDPLERLERKGYLDSYLTEPTKARGGRSKRIYYLTQQGKKALIEIRSILDNLTAGAAEITLESKPNGS